MKSRIISTPGRICLFGEHQDYLHLPVIAAAINKRVNIKYSINGSTRFTFELPDIEATDGFELDSAAEYRHDRDYFKSSIQVLRKHGYAITEGLDVHISGNIPINSGTSSSSALVVSWIATLLDANGYTCSSAEIADFAVQAEVHAFGEPGGIMDQYSTALGGMIYLNTATQQVSKLPVLQGTFVLGDSGLPKATHEVLTRTKAFIFDAVNAAKNIKPDFKLDQDNCPTDWKDKLGQHYTVLKQTIRNRDITQEALKMIQSGDVDPNKIGALLTEEHQILDQVYGLVPDKLNAMLDAAINAGAYGGKINGSGGGGCIFVYAPNDPEKVANAIASCDAKAYIIQIDEGVRYENG